MMTGDRLRYYRKNAGYTQKALGLALGYSEVSAIRVVQLWESNRRPIPVKYWRDISRILSMPMDELIP